MNNSSEQAPFRYLIRQINDDHPTTSNAAGNMQQLIFEDVEPISIPSELLHQLHGKNDHPLILTSKPDGTEVTIGDRIVFQADSTNNRNQNLIMNGQLNRGPRILIPQSLPIFTAGIGFDGTPTTFVQTRRTNTKVVQAIPFVSSTPCTSSAQTVSTSSYSTAPQLAAPPQWYFTSSPVPPLSSNSNSNLGHQGNMQSSTSANTSIDTSSETPDSGIQSVPTSPPSPSFLSSTTCGTLNQTGDSFCEDKFEDFTDMPLLLPADQDDEEEEPMHMTMTTPSAVLSTVASSTCIAKEDGASHASECETAAAPSISISPSMDSDEIVNRLMALDPEKASAIAMLIKKKTQQPRKRKSVPIPPPLPHQPPIVEKYDEEEVSSTTSSTPKPKKVRTCTISAQQNKKAATEITSSSSPSQELVGTSTDQEEPSSSAFEDHRKKETKHVEVEEAVEDDTMNRRRQLRRKATVQTPAVVKKVEEEVEVKQEIVKKEDGEDPIVQYRLAVQKKLEEAVNREIEKCIDEMAVLKVQLHHNSSSKSHLSKKKNTWLKLLNSSKKAMKVVNPNVVAPKNNNKSSATPVVPKKISKACELEEYRKSRFSSRRSNCRSDESPELKMLTEGRFNGEYEEIPRSFALSDEVFPLWRAPSLSCGCTKGACTSDVECLNRALRVQCSSECTVTLCANKKFWREDTSRLCVSNGPKSKRFLKTRASRRAGELLCEYAGEVITSQEAINRFSATRDSRILAIGANLFIDATARGNFGRFVKHSCKPNSRLEVWSINGYYRAGIFTLYDIASNCEITIDKTGLIPLDVPCICGYSDCCKKVVRAAKNSIIASANLENLEESEESHRRFLLRNRRKIIEKAKHSSGLPASLFVSEPKRRSESVKLGMRRVFEAIAYRVRNIDGSIKLKYLQQYSAILNFLQSQFVPELKSFNEMMKKWLELVDDDDIDRSYVPIYARWLPNELFNSSDEKEKDRRNSNAGSYRSRLFSTTSTTSSITASCHSPSTSSSSGVISKRSDADLSYLKTKWEIGSYDPDDVWDKYRANANDNAVRCVCGALDEDGEMVQCDSCHFWLHIDCVTEYNEDDDYNCDFCNGKVPNGRPSGDVKLQSQPELRFEDCSYYKALVNRRGIQVRLNETVYVNKNVSDDHKVLLRNLKERSTSKKKLSKDDKKTKFDFPKAPTGKIKHKVFERKHSRIFRVERLFVTPGNNRFVFGSFYAWPHETYVDTLRTFSKNEVFATTLYETLPLDEVIGRCMVIDVDTWCKGRPTVPLFKEDDIFLCEFQLGKNQRCFEKVPAKNRYPINTQPYVFEKYSKPAKIVRDFRPYAASVTPSMSSPSSSAAGKIQKSIKDQMKDRKVPRKSAQRNLQNIIDKLMKK